MTPDKLAIMPRNRCILQVQGVRPFYSRKYDITQHPMYPLLYDNDERNAFDVRKYMRRRMKRLNPNEEYAVYEVDVRDATDAGKNKDIHNDDSADDPEVPP